MKLEGETPSGTKVYSITLEEWAEWERGPQGTCKGCNEPNFACQCDDKEDE